MRILRLAAATLLLLSARAAAADPVVPPSIGAGFANPRAATSPLGSNLAAVTDYTAEYPFVDRFRMARPWFSGTADTFQDGRSLAKDRRGNVRSLLPGQVARSVLFTGAPADPALKGARFDVFHDGDGDLAYGNVRVLDRAPGHDAIELASPADPGGELTVIFTVTRTDPDDPLRNVRVLPSGGICVRDPLHAVSDASHCPAGEFRAFAEHHASIVFDPAFLTSIRRYRSLRFMDWMRTNGSRQTEFRKRARPSDQFWSTARGVPLEVMIALANLMDADPWFNVPHRADDAWVAGFAALLDAQLEPGRRAYVEYSNEVWNSIFPQTAYATRKGIEAGIDTLEGRRDAFAGMLHFYARRARQVFAIVADVMDGTDRIRRVLATQAVNPFLTREILGFEDAAASTDAFAIAPYFGDTIVSQAKRDELLALGIDGVFRWLLHDDDAVLDHGSLASVDRAIRAQAATVADFGLPLIAYEGGQHFVAAGAFQRDPALNALLDDVNRDPRIALVYEAWLDAWRAAGGSELHHFVNTDRWSIFGRWGAKEFPGQPRSEAPKYDALMRWIAQHPR